MDAARAVALLYHARLKISLALATFWLRILS